MGSSSPDREGRTAESPAAKKNPTKLKAEVKKSLIASQFASGFEFLPEGAIDKLFIYGIETFCKKLQWIVLALVFSINEPGYDLGPSCVLPFPEKIVKWGGTFGDVSRCEIHPSHLLDPSNQCPQYVAVKELRDAGDRQKLFRSWEKEADILRKMNKLEQLHIVRFFTAFKRGIPGNESHYLMFEWADGGDRDGIGTFKVGDWGLAKQHQFFTELRSFRTTTSGGTRIYEPPEEAASQGANLVPGRTGKKRSRLYDIWAMGCITLEFLIWLVYGYDQAEQFIAKIIQSNPNAPRFYQVRQDNINQSVATVHEVAEKWMDHMAKDPIFSADETALGNVLELLRKRLLVVKLPERLGTSDFRSNDIMTPRRDALSDGAISADPVDQSTTSEMAKGPTREIPGIVLSEPEEAQAESTQETPGIVVSEPEALQDSQDADPKLFSRLFSKPGWERARSDQFYDSMLEIAGEDEKDSYWFTDPPILRKVLMPTLNM
ncbi:hypothetical protein COL922a_011208 [Colletotrichum nupharicola]|nr:hypothetical protein COL922a_011208 [Colletotrichum nupharicola]